MYMFIVYVYDLYLNVRTYLFNFIRFLSRKDLILLDLIVLFEKSYIVLKCFYKVKYKSQTNVYNRIYIKEKTYKHRN